MLARHTATPDRWWFGVDTAWGAHPLEWRDLPTFWFAGERYLLFSGRLDGLEALAPELAGAPYSPWEPRPEPILLREMDHLQPGPWWPDDHAWMLHWHIDAEDTYVGGSRELAIWLLGEPRLAAHEVSPSDPVGHS